MSVEMPNYYAVIPANVRYDKRLKPNAKLLYGEITSLTNKTGYCWAENSYFADLFEVSTETISRWVSQLEKLGYLSVEIQKSKGNKRRISLFGISVEKVLKNSPKNDDLPIDEKVNTYCQKSQEVLTKKSRGIDKKVKSYNRINNKYNIKYNNIAQTPLEFLEKNSFSMYETLLINYQQKIKDFDHVIAQANLKIQSENIEWIPKVLFARFQYFLNNWVYNDQKNTFGNNQQNDDEVILPQSKKIGRK